MITDEQIIKTLKNIKKYCRDKEESCYKCRFYLESADSVSCQIKRIIMCLNNCPEYWDIDELERIIKQ